MKLIFVGGMYPTEQYKEMFRLSGGYLSYASNKYQWCLMDGFDANCVERPIVISAPYIPYFPKYKQIRIHASHWDHQNGTDKDDFLLPFTNIRGIRQFSRYRSIVKTLRKLLKETDESCCILAYSLDYSILRALCRLKKEQLRFSCFAFVPDLPGVIAKYESKASLYKRISSGYNLAKIDEYRSALDGYVLMAEKMSQQLKLKHDDYCIVDGILDKRTYEKAIEIEPIEDDRSKKRIIYTGSLNHNSGIELLLNAFESISGSEFQLIIAGTGSQEDIVVQYAEKDNRIAYIGSVPSKDIMNVLLTATVLVNPRPLSGIDAEVSFPSKTIEYMVTGIPVVMFHLPGVSDEYFDYLYTFNSEEPTEMASTLLRICNLNELERRRVGAAAKEFVVERKNCYIQTKKLLNFLDEKSQTDELLKG